MMIHPNFDPVAFKIANFGVHWYGITYLVGFLGFLLLGRYRAARYGWQKTDVDDMLFYGVLGVILGGRLGYVLFYKWADFAANPISIIKVWEGGMAFHGGLLGVMVAMWLYSRKMQRPWLAVTDFIAPLVPIGLGMGRIGNFINGELWGRPTDPNAFWAMVFPKVDSLARHPSQLYQFALEGVLLFCVLMWLARKPRATGFMSGCFALGYGVLRFIAEYAREPDSYLGLQWLSLSRGQWLCVPMIIIGIGLILYSKKQNKGV